LVPVGRHGLGANQQPQEPQKADFFSTDTGASSSRAVKGNMAVIVWLGAVKEDEPAGQHGAGRA